MWLVDIFIPAVARLTVSELSSSAEDELCRETSHPCLGEEMRLGTWGVDRSHLIHYRNTSGCHGEIRIWWQHYRWGWRKGSVRSDSLSIRPPHQVMISTGTCRIKSLLNNSVTHFGHPLGLLPSSSNVITHTIVVIGSNLHYLIQFLIPCHLKFYKKTHQCDSSLDWDM